MILSLGLYFLLKAFLWAYIFEGRGLCALQKWINLYLEGLFHFGGLDMASPSDRASLFSSSSSLDWSTVSDLSTISSSSLSSSVGSGLIPLACNSWEVFLLNFLYQDYVMVSNRPLCNFKFWPFIEVSNFLPGPGSQFFLSSYMAQFVEPHGRCFKQQL